MKKLHVKLIRSAIKRVEAQKRVVASLGLRKLNHVKIHDDNPVIRGMIYKVRHLLEVTEVEVEQDEVFVPKTIPYEYVSELVYGTKEHREKNYDLEEDNAQPQADTPTVAAISEGQNAADSSEESSETPPPKKKTTRKPKVAAPTPDEEGKSTEEAE